MMASLGPEKACVAPIISLRDSEVMRQSVLRHNHSFPVCHESNAISVFDYHKKDGKPENPDGSDQGGSSGGQQTCKAPN